MCGISGILNLDHREPVSVAALKAMNNNIVHRGPDDAGFFVSGHIGLGMRRLIIVDLQTGQQPMSNEDGTVHIVFNGEIYNHADLRQKMQSRGHQFRTKSDTESILHLYEEYGSQCVTHLRGMFAFAIWDSRTKRLTLARDRLGVKPLYFQILAGSLIFSSEIKGLLAFPGVPRQLNTAALPEYLAFGYLSGDETLFRNVRALPPGHTLQVDNDGKVQVQQYWELSTGTPTHEADRYYVDGYRSRLESAVSSHLMSDVPLGVFLSGGLDSSTVAALATKLSGSTIDTFSVGYEEEAYSELSYARQMARHIGSNHSEVRLSANEFFGLLPKLIWHEDEPITWPSSVSLYAVAQLARQRVKVVLTGEGSDETLGGYSRYMWTRWNLAAHDIYRRVAPGSLRRKVRGALSGPSRAGVDLRRKLGHTFIGRDGDSWSSIYFDNFYSAFSSADQAALMNMPVTELACRKASELLESSSGDLLSRLLYTDIKTYLQKLLMKQDRMSMAASIESRVPFLDHELVEFAYAIPSRLKIKGTQGKHILKKCVQDLLPHSILNRPKVGFPTPLSKWLRGPSLDAVESMLLSERCIDRDLFDPGSLRRLFSEHRVRSQDHCDRIWRLLNLELWQRIFIDPGADQLKCPEVSFAAMTDSRMEYFANAGVPN
jgi:asparagine synthase (glutamine-hydrolysing)